MRLVSADGAYLDLRPAAYQLETRDPFSPTVTTSMNG
jgi:hypothetical protein